jgi:hypothetical protein
MKKELLAVLLLVSILIACLINIRCVTGLTEELAAMVDDAEAQASSGNWEDARHTIEDAFDLLERRNLYTGVALSLEDIDMITDSLDLIMGHIRAHSPGRVTAAVHLAKSRLYSIAAREQVSFESVF